MLKVLSSHVFLKQRLHPGLLDAFERGGAQGVELFASRQHFDYTSRTHVKEIGDWLRDHPVAAYSMHMPLYADSEMGRDGSPAVNLVHPEKSRRIDSMDETKRALEAAEQIPFQYLVVHLGEREDGWSPRTLEHSITALEHLRAFARPLGVKLLLENLQNEVTEPKNLLEIVSVGHFDDVGVCLDLGHAHIGNGVPAALEELKPLIVSSHIHDNQGAKDEHLWPGQGTIDWAEAAEGLRTAPKIAGGVLEIHYQLGHSPEEVADKARTAFEKLAL